MYDPLVLTEETEKIVEEAINYNGASSMKEMGKIMGSIKKAHGQKIDMALVSKCVKAKLGG